MYGAGSRSFTFVEQDPTSWAPLAANKRNENKCIKTKSLKTMQNNYRESKAKIHNITKKLTNNYFPINLKQHTNSFDNNMSLSCDTVTV